MCMCRKFVLREDTDAEHRLSDDDEIWKLPRFRLWQLKRLESVGFLPAFGQSLFFVDFGLSKLKS